MIGVDPPVAQEAAEDELQRLGFRKDLELARWTRAPDTEIDFLLIVTLPSGFPYELPAVFVERATLARRVPHVERSGKVCIAANAGLFIDPTRPRTIVREVIDRARKVLAAGLAGELDHDFLTEFGAYWPSLNAVDVVSFCNPRGPSRIIAVGAVAPRAKNNGPRFLAVDSQQQLRSFAERLGMRLTSVEDAWFVSLPSAIVPPAFEEESSLRHINALVQNIGDASTRHSIEQWCFAPYQAPMFLFSFPLDGSTGDVVFGLRSRAALPTPNGFRPGRAPLRVALTRHANQQLERFSPQRADPVYLSRRTGSQADISAKRVLVVGCGAVGGNLALMLVDAGIAHLSLVDPDRLRAENAMRHVLGLSRIGFAKATGLKSLIESRLPHVQVQEFVKKIESLIADTPEVVSAHDLVVLATGDHTLELRVSAMLRRRVRLAHVWVEAHGVGAHVLFDGRTEKGCLACMYDGINDVGLYCKASLYAPGQDFTASVGGCAGVFTPFVSADAQRAAVEAVRLAMRYLRGELTVSTLVTWYESNEPFSAKALKSSARARLLTPGTRVELTTHAGCPRCA